MKSTDERSAAIKLLVDVMGSAFPSPETHALATQVIERGLSEDEIASLRESLGTPPTLVAVGETSEENSKGHWRRSAAWLDVMPEELRAEWSEAAAVINAKYGVTPLRHPERIRVMTGPNTPYSLDELQAVAPEAAAALIAAWRPSSAEPWGVSARGLERALASAIAADRPSWAERPVEMVGLLRHPTYIASYFQALGEGADELGDRGPELARAVAFANTSPWPVEELGERDGYDFDESWETASVHGVALLSRLWSAGVELGDADEEAWSAVLDAADAEDDGASPDFENSLLTRAINSTGPRALEAAFAYAGRMNDVEKRIPVGFLDLLDSLLNRRSDLGLLSRAIIATRLPFLRMAAPEWFDSRADQILGATVDKELGAKTFATYIEWGAAYSPLLDEQQEHYRDALARRDKRIVDHLISGMFWGVGIGSPPAMFVEILDDQQLSEAGDRIGRGIENTTDAELITIAIEFWDAAILDARDSPAYFGFGWFAQAKSMDESIWLARMQSTLELSGGSIDWEHAVAERAARSPKSTIALKLLTSLVLGQHDAWDYQRIFESALTALGESGQLGRVPERATLRDALLSREVWAARDAFGGESAEDQN